MKTLTILLFTTVLCFGQIPQSGTAQNGITYTTQNYGRGLFPVTQLQFTVPPSASNAVALKITITLTNGQTAFQCPVVDRDANSTGTAWTYFVVDWSQVTKMTVDALVVGASYQVTQ